MSMKIKRIIEDLGDNDIDIQILALTTIPRLSVESVLVPEELAQLKDKVDQARKTDNSDIVFLARKAANYLDDLSKQVDEARAKMLGQEGAAPEPSVEAPPPQPEATPEPEQVPPPAEPTLDDVLGVLRSDQDPTQLATSLAALRKVGNEECLPDVLPFLQHADSRVRSNAIEVVEDFGSKEHIPHLIPLAKDADNRVRSNTIKALGHFGHPQVRFYLKQMLASQEVRMRESAVYSMDQLKDNLDVLDLLIQASADDYEGIRLRAVRALKDYDLPEAVEALKRRVGDNDDAVRQEACQILKAKGADIEKLLSKELERAEEPDRAVVDSSLGATAEEDPANLLDAKVSAVEDSLFHAVVERISKGLQLQEQRAHLSRLLFSVGTQGYELCRKGTAKEKPMMVCYYEIVRYQEYLAQLAERLRSQKGDNAAVVKAGIEQYHGKIRDCFIKMGKHVADLHQQKKIEVETTKELKTLLRYLSPQQRRE